MSGLCTLTADVSASTGREADLARLAGVHARGIETGRGALVLVTMPTGEGRTDLLREFEGRVGGLGTLVLRAAAGPGERLAPFAVAERLVGSGALPASVRDAARACLASILAATPRLVRDPHAFAVGAADSHPVREFSRLFEALAAAGPIVVEVDDVLDADRLSVELLLHLAGQLLERPFILVLAERPELSPTEAGLHNRLVREATDRLGPEATMSPDKVRASAADRVGEACEELVERESAVSALDRALARSGAGRARTVLVEGAIGMGKSALAWSFLERAESRGVLSFGVHIQPEENTLTAAVLDRMFRNAAAPERLRTALRGRLSALREGGAGASDAGRLPADGDGLTERCLRGLAAELVELAQSVPLLLLVDDIHHLDADSLNLLAHLLPTAGADRILVLLTADESRDPTRWRLPTELLLRPNFQRVRVHRLSEDGMRRAAARRLGNGAAPPMAELAALSAGNPLVLGQLIGAHEAAGGGHVQAYGRAFVECLRRCPAETVEVVRALALLGEQATVKRAAELSGVGRDAVGPHLLPLSAAGLLDVCAFRHPAAAAAVLADMPAERRAALHRRAALLLFDEGAPALDVAHHLIRADEHEAPWIPGLLLDAASEALAADQMRLAVDCLRLARRVRLDPDARLRAEVRLSRLEWQLKPLAAARHLQPQLEHGAQARLSPRDTLDLAWRTAWFGQVDELGPLLVALDGRADGGADADDLAAWLTLTFPDRPFSPRMTTPSATAASGEPWLHAAAALARGLVGGPAGQRAGDFEQVLRSLTLDPDSLWSGETASLALLTLVYGDRLEAAISHSERLLAEAVAAGLPAWHAVFTAIRAEALFRQGDLPAAFRHAVAALAEIPTQGWGAAVGLPLGCAVHAAVRMGDMAAAKRLLGASLPDSALRGWHGLHYLHARGHYRMAAGLSQAALADFLACGSLTARWGAQGVSIVPWRTSAAEAWAQHGDADQARRLLRDQLAVLPPTSRRARGQAMRVLAGVSRDSRRPQLLADAVDLLKDCGDRYELARALTDLSAAQRQAGEQRRARRTARRALHFAKVTGAEPLRREAAPDEQELEETGLVRAEAEKLSQLTGQELRVATLAVEGNTNHEIAAKLYITPSTVEQHLTRVFRKLDVKRRDQLPRLLDSWRPHGAV